MIERMHAFIFAEYESLLKRVEVLEAELKKSKGDPLFVEWKVGELPGCIQNNETNTILHKTIDVTSPTLLQCYEYYIEEQSKLIGVEFGKVSDTIRTYRTRSKKLIEYLKFIDHLDIYPKDINGKFVREFEYWIRSNKLSINYAMKNLQLLNTVLQQAKEDGYLNHSPFDNYKFRYNREYDKTVLEIEDVITLTNHIFRQNHIQKVVDVFVFCCFTGLSYSDCRNFNRNTHIRIGIDNKEWLVFQRVKIKTSDSENTIVPFFDEPKKILEKYGDSLPVFSNQKMNSYIKEAFEIAGINKYITTHTARRSFGHIMHNHHAVPIDSVSKMMGHKSVKTTQTYYVKTLMPKIHNDTKDIKEFFKVSNVNRNRL